MAADRPPSSREFRAKLRWSRDQPSSSPATSASQTSAWVGEDPDYSAPFGPVSHQQTTQDNDIFPSEQADDIYPSEQANGIFPSTQVDDKGRPYTLTRDFAQALWQARLDDENEAKENPPLRSLRNRIRRYELFGHARAKLPPQFHLKEYVTGMGLTQRDMYRRRLLLLTSRDIIPDEYQNLPGRVLEMAKPSFDNRPDISLREHLIKAHAIYAVYMHSIVGIDIHQHTITPIQDIKLPEGYCSRRGQKSHRSSSRNPKVDTDNGSSDDQGENVGTRAGKAAVTFDNPSYQEEGATTYFRQQRRKGKGKKKKRPTHAEFQSASYASTPPSDAEIGTMDSVARNRPLRIGTRNLALTDIYARNAEPGGEEDYAAGETDDQSWNHEDLDDDYQEGGENNAWTTTTSFQTANSRRAGEERNCLLDRILPDVPRRRRTFRQPVTSPSPPRSAHSYTSDQRYEGR